MDYTSTEYTRLYRRFEKNLSVYVIMALQNFPRGFVALDDLRPRVIDLGEQDTGHRFEISYRKLREVIRNQVGLDEVVGYKWIGKPEE